MYDIYNVYIYIYKTKTETKTKTKTKAETKTKTREGGVRRDWGEDMHLYYGISPYKSTIQFYHTGSPYNKNANFSGLSCNSLSGYTYYIT
jgi:hypothetical protein